MPQMNLHITKEFDEELERLMRVRRLRSRSEAVRTAIHEALVRALAQTAIVDFSALIGFAAKASANPAPRFRDDDDLWNG